MENKNLFSFKSLLEAEKRAANSKHTRREVVAYELNLGQNICDLEKRLAEKRYKPSEYYRFTVFEPKQRVIQALHFEDRIVQNCFCNEVLKPYFEPRLIYDCAACRVGKGTHFAMNRLSGFMRDYYKHHGRTGYLLKIDIRRYFDSIDHEALKNRLKRFPKGEAKEFLFDIIDSYERAPGEKKGLPMGNQSSQWLALYYLDRIDREVKEQLRIRYYTRYMDDLVMIHQDKSYLKQVLIRLRRIAEDELKLEFNQKTQISPLSQGIDYLGFRFFLTDTGKVIRRLRTNSKRRFKKRLKSLKKKYASGEVTYEKVRSSIASYIGHLKHGNTYRLRERVFSRMALVAPRQNTENSIDYIDDR